MTVILLVTAFLFMGPMPIAAWNEPEEFRGLKLGQNLKDQVRECPPHFSDTKERCWKLAAPPDAYGSVLYSLHNFGPIGDLGQGRMVAMQLNDRLISIMVTLDFGHFE